MTTAEQLFADCLQRWDYVRQPHCWCDVMQLAESVRELWHAVCGRIV